MISKSSIRKSLDDAACISATVLQRIFLARTCQDEWPDLAGVNNNYCVVLIYYIFIITFPCHAHSGPTL